MGTCLTKQDLAAYVSGSATPEQLKAWMSHVAKCETCAKKVTGEDGEVPEPAKPASASTTASGITPGTRLGDFEIEKRVGSGGMGIRLACDSVARWARFRAATPDSPGWSMFSATRRFSETWRA